MARIVFAERALADLDRLLGFLLEQDPEQAILAVDRIVEAVSLLDRHPLLGHPVEEGLRELAISHGRTGYLALYRYRKEERLVLILAVRHQREAGYVDPDA